MSLYIEVFCDARLQGTDPHDVLLHRCWSDRNESPQGRSVAAARSDAKATGWRRVGGRDICPGCQVKDPRP